MLDLGVALDDPSAGEAGLTPALVGGFAVVYENLNPEQREERALLLRHLLSRGLFRAVAVIMHNACLNYNVEVA